MNGIALTTVSKITTTLIANVSKIDGFSNASLSFVTTWKTDNAGTSTSTQITVPTVSSGSYNCVVDWGDGTSSTITTYNDAAWTHTFPIAGTYTVTITGTFYGFSFNNGGDKLKILSVLRWGPNFRLGIGAVISNFIGCSNLTIPATDTIQMSGVTSLESSFRLCPLLTNVPSLINADISSVTSLTNCFRDSTGFNTDISGWNTSNVTLFGSAFMNCTSFNQNIGSWNTSGATTFQSMFNGATSFNQNIGSWNITALTNATNMFAGVTLSNAIYNRLLAGWGAFVTPHNSVVFSGGNSHYDTTSGGVNGTAGRLLLSGTYLWTITDGGTP